MRVLIADDHPVVLQGLKRILASSNDIMVIGEARSGGETIELAGKLDWDVALMDYSMPGRSGLDLLKELKRNHPRRPVLVLSVYPEELHAMRVLKAGGSGYISKETASEELAPAIRKAITGGKYVSPALAEKLAVNLSPGTDNLPHEALSDREYRVMWLLASGKAITRIAREMSLSPSTVSTYRARILKKLNVASNAEVVHYAIKHNLVE